LGLKGYLKNKTAAKRVFKTGRPNSAEGYLKNGMAFFR
jgi:hypothetical protein